MIVANSVSLRKLTRLLRYVVVSCQRDFPSSIILFWLRSIALVQLPALRDLASSLLIVRLDFGPITVAMAKGCHLEVVKLFMQRHDGPS